ncbi:MAG TPA: Zn-dependent alcohol dehydrogenase [Polyangiales bacterium]|nr:Zn-dependent alcohol dehydrogenase [Polyangiales bacterium]
MKAVVVNELNKVVVEDVELGAPKAGEVKVRMVAAGVCHSDLSVINGTIPHPLPVVLGHEGAGVVEAVGEGVTNCKPGDHVIMSFVPNCGTCFHCVRGEAFLCRSLPRGGTMPDGTQRLKRGDKGLAAFCSLGNMAEYTVCPAMSVVAVDKNVPLKVAALIGCGVTTGVGAAINTAEVKPGSNVAVFGCGGVGIAVIQGARIAGANRIFAVDVSEEKLALAKRFGATDGVRAEQADSILAQTGGIGVDYAFEAIGKPSVVEAALKVTRRGGTTVALGVGKLTETISLNGLGFPLSGKRLCGCVFGSANPKYDFPRLLELYASGKLDLEGMVTRTYTIDQAPQAFQDLERGANTRGVIVLDSAAAG